MIKQDGDKENLFWQKPGYTWGMSTRTQPKQVSGTSTYTISNTSKKDNLNNFSVYFFSGTSFKLNFGQSAAMCHYPTPKQELLQL